MADSATKRLGRAWERFDASLKRLGTEARLCPGATDEALSGFEAATGLMLPEELKSFWRGHDGEEPFESGLAGGFCFVSVTEAQKILDDWRRVREKLGAEAKRLDRSTSSRPMGAIQRKYSVPGWVPLLRDFEGNYVGVDLEPGPSGTTGQVINFGRDELDKAALFGSVVELLEWLAEELEQGRITLEDADGDEDENEEEVAIVHVHGRLVAAMPKPDR